MTKLLGHTMYTQNFSSGHKINLEHLNNWNPSYTFSLIFMPTGVLITIYNFKKFIYTM